MPKKNPSSPRDLLVLEQAHHASAGLRRRVRSEQLHVLVPNTAETRSQFTARLRRRLKRVQEEGGATSLTLTLGPRSDAGWLSSPMTKELTRSVAAGGELIVLGFGVPASELMRVVGTFMEQASEPDVSPTLVVRAEVLPPVPRVAAPEPRAVGPFLTPLARAHEPASRRSGNHHSGSHHRGQSPAVSLAG